MFIENRWFATIWGPKRPTTRGRSRSPCSILRGGTGPSWIRPTKEELEEKHVWVELNIYVCTILPLASGLSCLAFGDPKTEAYSTCGQRAWCTLQPLQTAQTFGAIYPGPHWKTAGWTRTVASLNTKTLVVHAGLGFHAWLENSDFTWLN